MLRLADVLRKPAILQEIQLISDGGFPVKQSEEKPICEALSKTFQAITQRRFIFAGFNAPDDFFSVHYQWFGHLKGTQFRRANVKQKR